MQALRDRLTLWVDAGLISAEQADRIEEHERRLAPDDGGAFTLDAGREDVPPRRRRSVTSPAEAIGYVGAALALGAIALILGDLWRELLVGGRLALVGVVTVAMFGGGLAVRASASTAMQRLTSVLFAATVAGTGWFAGVVGSDLLDLSWSRTQVVVSVAMAAVALPLFLWRQRPLPQIVALGSITFAMSSLLELSPLRPGAGWYGLVIATVGVTWFLLAAGRWVIPRTVGEVTGALVALLGIQVASFGDARIAGLAVGLVLAAVLVVLAVQTDVLHHLVVGALGLFVLSPQLVFEVFGDAIGAPATLLLVGVLLVLLAVGLGRARREVVPGADAAPQEVSDEHAGGAR
jgi:MFS family permease